MIHVWGKSDNFGRSQCSSCGWWRMVAGDRSPLYSLVPSLTGTWSVVKPACNPKQAEELRKASA